MEDKSKSKKKDFIELRDEMKKTLEERKELGLYKGEDDNFQKSLNGLEEEIEKRKY